ncbi:MAG TPA: PDZ domain-containing protein [Longimicrobiaceae bacterium]|nr:PDZ domain-containing protein [Longimicrobiaceae bacterium]
MKLAALAIGTLALASAASEARAQVSPASAQTTHSVVSRSRHANAGYTGFSYQGRPRPLPDGTPRWADFPVVTSVDPASPAGRVGIRVGDVVLSVNGVDARDPRAMFLGSGTVATFVVRRENATREFVLRTTVSPS